MPLITVSNVQIKKKSKFFICSGSALSSKASSQALHLEKKLNRLRMATGRRQTSWLYTIFFFSSLPLYLINDLERVQKRALSIIYPYVSYNEALVQAGLSRLVDHHQDLCKSLFYNILEDTNHRLHHLLPPQFSTSYSLRNPRTFDIKFNTKRAKNTFFNAQCHLVNSFKA